MGTVEILIHAAELVGIGVGIWLTGQNGETGRLLADSMSALSGAMGYQNEKLELQNGVLKAVNLDSHSRAIQHANALNSVAVEVQNGFKVLQEARKPGRKSKAPAADAQSAELAESGQ